MYVLIECYHFSLHEDYEYLEKSIARPENLTTFWNLENGYPIEAPIDTYPHRGSVSKKILDIKIIHIKNFVKK
jgi:hypothetical protein